MQAIQVAQARFERLIDSAINLLSALRVGVPANADLHNLMNIMESIAVLELQKPCESTGAQQSIGYTAAAEKPTGPKLSFEEAAAIECTLLTPERKFIFTDESLLQRAMANGAGMTAMMKYAGVVLNNKTGMFEKHRGVGHGIANQILLQAGHLPKV